MNGKRLACLLGLVVVALLATARWGLWAQDDGPKRKVRADEKRDAPELEAISVTEALQRPFIMPFEQPTTLNDVCRHLRMMLKAPVVLDLAALDRQQLTAQDAVQLDLHGVRLKTGLKLLLDQVGLTYRVVPDDNLLVITDAEGSDDPLDRIHVELKAIHRDLHDVQDAIDEIREALGIDEDDHMRMRKPTMIEELPDEAARGPAKTPGKSKAPAPKEKPGAAPEASAPKSRPGL